MEMRLLQQLGVLIGVTSMVCLGAALLPSIVSFVIFVGIGGTLTPAAAFTTVSLFFGAYFNSEMIGLSLGKLGASRPAFERLNQLLVLPDLSEQPLDPDPASPWLLEMRNCSFQHYGDAHDEVDAFRVRHVSLQGRRGQFIMLAGAVGAGKSTMLLGVLREVALVEGNAWVRGRVALAPQTPFIMSASVRENVLFGLPFEERRFNECVRAACLDDDLRLLVDGADTEIGERGVTLSGGQKQRLSLCRALYADADVYLLDDTLSALDARVGKRVFEQLRAVLHDKLVLFANHQLQFASRFDSIVVLDKGEVVESGTFAELHNARGPFAAMLADYIEEGEEDQDDAKLPLVDHSTPTTTSEVKRDTTQVVLAETMATGAVTLRSWATYARALTWRFAFVLLGYAATLSARAYVDFHLAYWLAAEWTNFASWAGVYLGVAVAALLLHSITLSWHKIIAVRASSAIHDQMLRSVLTATQRWFHATPVGRILNRFTHDMDVADRVIPFTSEQFLTYFLESVSVTIVIAVVFPLLLAVYPVLLLGFALLIRNLRIGLRTGRRLEGVLRSLVFQALSTVMQGLPTVRAFNRMDAFKRRFEDAADAQLSLSFFIYLMSRHFSLRADLLVTLLIMCVSLLSLGLKAGGDGALASLAISYAIRIAANFQWSCENFISTEGELVSIERICEYSDPRIIELEPSRGAIPTPKNWPCAGVVEFDQLSVCSCLFCFFFFLTHPKKA